jgi:hypothetical protein
MLALAHLEEQLTWLTEKVRDDKDLIERAKAFFDKMEDQLFYEEHRLEMLAWQIVEAREGRSGDIYSLPKT